VQVSVSDLAVTVINCYKVWEHTPQICESKRDRYSDSLPYETSIYLVSDTDDVWRETHVPYDISIRSFKKRRRRQISVHSASVVRVHEKPELSLAYLKVHQQLSNEPKIKEVRYPIKRWLKKCSKVHKSALLSN